MNCTECRSYSKAKRACGLGKANPKTKKNSIEVAALMGWDYICLHNSWKANAIDSIRLGFPVPPEVCHVL